MTEADAPGGNSGRGEAATRGRGAGDEEHWVDRWPISQRMALAIGLPVVLLVAGAIFVTVQGNQLEALHDEEGRERDDLATAIELERSFGQVVQDSQAYVLTGEARNRSAMESSMSSFEDLMEEYEPSADEQDSFDQVELNASAYMDIARRAQGHVEEDEMERAREVLTSQAATEARSNTVAAIENIQTTERRDVEDKRAAIDEAQSDLEGGLVLMTLGAVAATSLLGYDVTRRTRGTLGDQTRTLQDRLDDLQVAQSRQRERHDAQRTRIEATKTRVGEVLRACEDINDRLTSAVEMAGEIEQAAETGNERLEGTLSSLDESDASVSTVADRVLDIGEELQQLEDVAEDVSSIADQIDMLALNASVEASRARGESKGLDEIRDLAERSQERGRRIQTILATAREESDAAAIALETGGKAVDETRTLAMETSEAFAQVEDSLEEGLEEMQDIERLAEEQSQAMEDVQEALADIEGEVEASEDARERADRLVADLEDVARRLREVS